MTYGDAAHQKLKKAFDLVAPKDNWKFPINVVVDDGTLEAQGLTLDDIAEAVPFFTGSVARITPVTYGCPKGTTGYQIKARGYYAAIGA